MMGSKGPLLNPLLLNEKIQKCLGSKVNGVDGHVHSIISKDLTACCPENIPHNL